MSKKSILEKYQLDNESEIVIIALPQFVEHNELPWREHWEEIHFLLKTLDGQPNKNILISLHPRMDKKNYTFLEHQYDVKILNERLADVLPIADLFVATYSGTVMGCICGVKSVVVLIFTILIILCLIFLILYK